MDFAVRKNDLLRELQLFQGIVERKNTIPILANVLMEVKENGIGLLATDLEVALRSRCDATVKSGGTLTLPAKKLYEIVKALPDTEIRIKDDKTGVRVSADRFESHMQTQPAEDFPAVPEPAGGPAATFGSAVIRSMVTKTQFAITGEDTRYFLNGALFIVGSDSMTLVATDGYRLALVKVPRGEGGKSGGKGNGKDKDGGDDERAILPRKTLWELGKLLGEDDGHIEYRRGENHLFFQVGSRMLVSRMIDGQFPAFERVIPTGNKRLIQFERDRLTNAVRRVALLSSERSKAVKFAIENGSVEVTSSSPEFGEARELISVDYRDEGMQICLNAQYVLDFLNVIETNEITAELKDDVSQAVLKPVGAEGYEYTYVIMPMRV